MPDLSTQLKTFINDDELVKAISNELLDVYYSGTPIYVNIAPDKSCYMPTFSFIDIQSKEPIIRLTFNMLVEPNQNYVNDLGLSIENRPIDVVFIQQKQDIKGFHYRYRIGVNGITEPRTSSTIQTANQIGVFDYVMDVEAIGSESFGKDVEGTIQRVSLSAFPYQCSVFDNMDEINEIFGFQKDKSIVGPDNLYQINGVSSMFVAPSELSRNDHDERGSCLIGKITKIKNVQIIFGEILLPCRIIWFLTGFGEIPFLVHGSYNDYEDYKIDKYIMMYAYVKADFGQRGKSFEEMKTESQNRQAQ